MLYNLKRLDEFQHLNCDFAREKKSTVNVMTDRIYNQRN